MLQIPMETQSSKGGLSWLLGANCETGFLYELLDIPKVDRDKYLNHALVMAFMYLKKTRMFIYLTAYQLFMVRSQARYIIMRVLRFIYFNVTRTVAHRHCSLCCIWFSCTSCILTIAELEGSSMTTLLKLVQRF